MRCQGFGSRGHVTLRVSLFVLLLSWIHDTTTEGKSQYIVELIGNDLRQSWAGVDLPGVVVLLNTPFPKDGVVYAFQAYFRSLQTTAFQIWRPTFNPSGFGEFTLIAEIQARPSVNSEPIYIISQLNFMKCIRVQKGDRFGVTSYTIPNSIGYTFNPFTTQALVYESQNETSIGEKAMFKNITFPYDLSCQAFYYLETSNSSSTNEMLVECPRDLSVNDVGNGITTTLIPTPKSGQPGNTGPQGSKGATGIQGPSGATGVQGATGSSGPAGQSGYRGPMGPSGPAGLAGLMGDAGDTGSPGPTVHGIPGATGPVGLQGPEGHLVHVNDSQALGYGASRDSDWSMKWTSELFLIGLLIWLSIISFIVLVLILSLIIVTCVICAIRRNDDKIIAKIKEFHRHENDPYGIIRKTAVAETELNSAEGMASGDSGHDTLPKPELFEVPTMDTWMRTMKDDSVQDYNVWYGVK